jgi:hypothetical protein
MSSSNADLYQRDVETLLASWEAYARAAVGAALHRLQGVTAAVFPNDPEPGPLPRIRAKPRAPHGVRVSLLG